jgi:hypothetical protein
LNDFSIYWLTSAVSRKITSAQAIAYFIKYLAPSHKVKAVDLLDSKLNVVCEKEVDCVKNSLLRTSSITYHWISLDTLPPKELTT